MKVLALLIALSIASPVFAEHACVPVVEKKVEEKKVEEKKADEKPAKKKHRKYEGTKIPDAKK
jgi:hypothetical protein